jgi:PAS domain S-box-containing protein
MANTINHLHATEDRFKGLINQAPFSTALLVGDDFIIEVANDISLQLWGKDSSVIGKPLLEAMPEMEEQDVYIKLKEVYHTGVTYEGKENIAYLQTPEGLKKIYVNLVFKAITDEEGTISAVFAVGYDVTEHVESRQRIAEAEERARLAVESAGLGTFDLNLQTDSLITSPRMDAIFGFRESRPYQDYIDAVHPDDRAIRIRAHEHSLTTGELDYSARIVRPDKTVRWARFKGTVFLDSDKKPLRLVGTILDITQQILAIKSLEESEQRFRTLITETQEVATGLYIGKEIRIQYVNDVMLKFWDKDQSVIGKPVAEAIPELKDQSFIDELRHVYETGETFTGKEAKAWLMRNGQLQPFYYNYTFKALRNSEGVIYGIHHVAIDVTEQVLNKQKYINSEKRFRDLLTHAPFGICILKGREFFVDFANEAFLEIVGRKSTDYIGKPLWEGIPEIESQIYNELLNEVMETGRTIHGKELEVRIIKNQQMQTLYVDFRYDAIKDEKGEVDGILALAIDVTDKVLGRNEIERSRDRFNTILETLPQIAWTADSQGKINYITQRWYDYTGQSRNAGLGDGWIKMFHNSARELLVKWQQAVAQGSLFEEEANIRRSDGEHRWHLIRAIPIRDDHGNVTLWVGTSTDIHDQKMFSEQLERKIKERTKELERSNAELEQFAYIASHDLQEPVRKITVFASMLKNELCDMPERSQIYLDKISASSARMQQLIRDLLEFSRLTKLENAFEPVDLSEVLQGIISDFDLMIEQKQATLHVEKLAEIEASPLQMRQLFYNLLSNSLKFSAADRTPHIEIKMKKLSDEEVAQHKDLDPRLQFIQIEWRDNGIGFSQEYADQVFVIFQRLNDRNAYSGTGIGLAICKRIVVNHHGEIFAHSEVDKGCTFYIVLPIKQSVN